MKKTSSYSVYAPSRSCLPKVPPKTCDEWLTSSSGAGHLVSTDGTLFMPSKDDGVIMWPIHPPHLDYLIAAPIHSGEDRATKVPKKHESPGDTILGSLEEIRADLEKHSAWDSSLLDEVERKLEQLEAGIDTSAESFVEDDCRLSKASVFGGLANVSDLAFMTELSEELLSLRNLSSSVQPQSAKTRRGLQSASRGTQRLQFSASPQKTDSEKENNLYKLIQENLSSLRTRSGSSERNREVATSGGSILIPLPGKLDALAILNLVNSSAKIPPYLMKSWKRIFFCSESVSILQNAFWWMWLDYFQPKKWIQSLLFNQIADDFVSILIKMDDKHKDEVFMRYPVYLAQALYSAFCQAFPSSNHELNTPKFMEYISNTTSEWIVGIKCQPEQWKQWPRHFLNPHFLSLQQERDSARSEEHRHRFTEKDMLSISQHLSQSIISKISSLTESTRMHSAPARRVQSAANKPLKRESSDNLSNFSTSKVEIGPVFECVRFSIYGRSPLLQHYLYHHNLSEFTPPAGLAMSRTQVKEIPARSITYKQVVRGHEKKSQRLYEEYQDQIAKTGHDIALIRNKYKAFVRKTEKQNRRLLQHRHEVARIAERLVASREDGIMDIQKNQLD